MRFPNLVRRLTWVSWTGLIILALSGVYGAQVQLSSGNVSHVICDSGCSGGGAVTSIDGGLVTLGANADAAVGDASGTVNSHLRQIAKQLAASVAVTFASPTLAGGTANIGFVRVLPSSCTQSTNFASPTVGVATGAGTTVTSTTTCVTFAYANNITNSAVTFRLADKAGTPVIWFGGNADFSIAANSSVHVPIEGVTFTSGITAIAGTASAINLQINGVQ